MSKLPTAEQIQHDWDTNPRWEGIQRNYSAADVVRLRGTVHIEHSLARRVRRSCGRRCMSASSSTRWAR
jgi:isocitrate lyase